ncbi:uncharacterized protein LOC100376686 [Saccoglossus kowalevskii]|uniref:Uncharacterized protein LOC100376686 n=1 Tax=Saccoglossus kowalevskii TaxID=10224 RepID=A0ABM0GWT8_SACKO|nr:PREDICTED: uncharacterized protein LOC100376686 [Saccoglossus kowalevskii]
MAKGKVMFHVAKLMLFLSGCAVVKSFNTVVMTNEYWNDCGKTISYSDANSGIIKAYREDYYTEDVYECTVTLEVMWYEQVLLKFETFDVYSMDDDCSDHSLKVYDGSSIYEQMLTPMNGLCTTSYYSTELPQTILSSSYSLTLVLSRNYAEKPADFNIIYSAVQTDADDFCFKCLDNDTCLSSEVKCDGLNNCPDGSDESYEEDGGCSDIADVFVSAVKLTLIIVVVVVVLIILVCVIFIVVIVCCCCRAGRSTTTTHTGTTVVAKPGTYPTQQSAYPVVQGTNPPQQGGYPPQQGGYPPQQGGYPPQQGGYPPQQGGYPPQQGGYPPQQGGYPPQQPPPAYPPQGVAYNPQQDQVDMPVEPQKV